MEICRACMSDSVTLVDIFCDRPLPDYQISLADMLNDFGDFQVKRDDKLPQKICVSCGLNAQIAFSFKRRLQQSHQLLCMKAMENENDVDVVVDAPQTAPGKDLERKISEKSKKKKRSMRKLRKSRDVGIIDNKPDKTDQGERASLEPELEEKANPPIGKSHDYSMRHGRRQKERIKPPNITKNIFQLSAHSKIRAFKCEQCQTAFTTMENLSRHQLSHVGERGYKCLHCPNTYRKKSKLQRHIWTHSKDHPHMCSECSQSFKSRKNLNQHLNAHMQFRPFKCLHCQQAFKTSSHLKRHAFLHTDKRPFECSTCGKGFTTNWSFKSHSCFKQRCSDNKQLISEN